MTSGASGEQEYRWLLEPPGVGEVHIHVAVGEGAQLTPAIRDALESLASAIEENDAQGFLLSTSGCPILVSCAPRNLCNPEYSGPCAWLTSCRIG